MEHRNHDEIHIINQNKAIKFVSVLHKITIITCGYNNTVVYLIYHTFCKCLNSGPQYWGHRGWLFSYATYKLILFQ